MNKVLLLLVLLFSGLFADSALIVKKGWSLIGSTSKITNMDVFTAKDVDQVWQYDASLQKWKGYAPDSTTQKKINDKGFEKITSLESWHGFWIKSKHEWGLTFKTDTTQSDENITLQKGWNLISLPINSVVSPHIFDKHTVWRYAKKDSWELYDETLDANFPTISHITNSDGIWVKSDKKQTISLSTDAAKLHNFSDEKEMKAYIRDMALTNNRPICGYYPMLKVVDTVTEDGVYAAAGDANKIASPQAAENASGTNIQEEGVDESDIIKHNDTNIFYVSSDNNRMKINITTFDAIISNNLKPLNTISVSGYINSLYLFEDKLVVLYNYIPNKSDIKEDERRYHVSSIAVDILNVSDIDDVKKVASFKIDGNMNESRMIDGKLFLVTNFRPFITKKYPHIYVDAPECKAYNENGGDVTSVPSDTGSGVSEVFEPKPDTKAIRAGKELTDAEYEKYQTYVRCYALRQDKDGRYYRLDYENPTIEYEVLVPQVTKDNQAKQPLITAQTLYASCKKNQEATITTVSKLDIQTATLTDTSSVLGYASTVYASKDALYLVSNKYPIFYNFDRYKERSAVYKFSLKDDLAYQAYGFVNGRVLNQFSLSEYDNILRLATTEGNSWQGDTINTLYTLSQSEDALLVQGVLSGLGKEGERIRSVRFVGNRAYIVTFRQTDPFYTIDLQDAQHPLKAGELNIEGYSSYLHPIDENHILGIGRDADSEGSVKGLKLELFNIEDFSNPKSVFTQSFGNQYSYSELEWNHKALAYRSSDKLLGFAYTEGGFNPQAKLGVFQIDGDSINAYSSISSPNSSVYGGGFERGVIFDFKGQSYVAYFANGQISYATLDSLK